MRGGVFERSPRARAQDQGDASSPIQIEKRYTKREIFTLYANQILGHGAYGVEAASRLYFGKSAKDADARGGRHNRGIIQTPARLSPFVNPSRTLRPAQQLRAAADGRRGLHHRRRPPRPRKRRSSRAASRTAGPVDRAVLRRGGPQGARADGTAPTRSIRPACACRRRSTRSCSEAAERRARRGLRRIDKRRDGYRKPARNVVAEGTRIEQLHARPLGAGRSSRGDIVPAVVISVPDAGEGRRASASARTRSSCRAPASRGRGETSPATLFKVGDVDRGRSVSAIAGRPSHAS